MPPNFLPRTDGGRIITDIFKRVERLERRTGAANTAPVTGTTGSGDTVQRAKAIEFDTGPQNGDPLFNFDLCEDESTFKWINAYNLKRTTSAFSFSTDIITVNSHVLVGLTLQGSVQAGAFDWDADLDLWITTNGGEERITVNATLWRNASPIDPSTNSLGANTLSWYGELHPGDTIYPFLQTSNDMTDAIIYRDIDIAGTVL